IFRAVRSDSQPTRIIGTKRNSTAWANSDRYQIARVKSTLSRKEIVANIGTAAVREMPRKRRVLIPTSASRSASAWPPWRRARWIMSKGTPMTQWLVVDHSTASAIQYQRFEKDRMSISSKTVRYQSTPDPFRWSHCRTRLRRGPFHGRPGGTPQAPLAPFGPRDQP